MAQNPATICPQCGAPVREGQPLCANCGLDLGAPPDERRDSPELLPTQPLVDAPTQAPEVQGQSSWHGAPPQEQSSWHGVPPAPPSQPTQKRPSGRVVLVLVLLLVLVGAGALFASRFMGVHLPGFGGPAGQSTTTTTQVNTTLTYAGADLTILTAVQAQSFADDASSSSGELLRLNIREENKTASKVNLVYNDIAWLKVAGQNAEAPTYVKAKGSIAPGATQLSYIDFAVPADVKVNQLALILGTASEAQLYIPLTPHADLSKYAHRTVSPNGQMSYLGLNYTLVSATSQWSIAGQQASKGMIYIVVTLKVDNTLSQQAIPGSAYDYMRLKAGNSSATPVTSTLPVSFNTGETGKTGTLTFLVPQVSRAFTLILLPQGGADQATSNFQLA